MMNYNVEKIRKELEEDLDRATTILNLWKKVSYPTKKNGEPFSTMSKNFSEATYKSSRFSYYGYEKELEVWGRDSKGNSQSDSINLYRNIRYIDKKDPVFSKPQNFCEYDEEIYIMDLDDIKKAVEERIEYWKKAVEEYTEDLKKVDSVYDHFYESIKKAMDDLIESTGSDRNSLYYLIRDSVKNY